jgi:hypothetical protein
MKTEDGCAYVVLKETVTWCVADNDCSDMPALTFFYAGADGGSIKPKPTSGSDQPALLYKACNSNCTDNNPWGALGSTFNLNLTESAAQNPQFDRVVKDICQNAAFAGARLPRSFPTQMPKVYHSLSPCTGLSSSKWSSKIKSRQSTTCISTF